MALRDVHDTNDDEDEDTEIDEPYERNERPHEHSKEPEPYFTDKKDEPCLMWNFTKGSSLATK